QKVGAKFAVAVNSATSALHIACLALRLGKGGLLWTVPNTFVASANCARYCGADVDFVDIDPRTWNLSIPRLEEKLAAAQQQGRLPDIVVPVHYAGQPTDQEAIWRLGQKYGFRIIEDASHAIGAAVNHEPTGSCRWSDITVFSFHPVKIITSGEGGMALTNDAALAERLAMLRSHGITRDPQRFEFDNAGAWYYEQQDLGFNYRLTDIHAALGHSQLRRLDSYVAERNRLARRYDQLLRGLPITLPTVNSGHYSAFHLYVIRVTAASTASRKEVFDAMRSGGVNVNMHYLPVHLHPYYRKLGFAPGQFPDAEAHAREALTLPLYPTLSEAEQNQVIDLLKAQWQ
ncbi:MAG TPA: UDP-4-amino-4,6-dideoxy-N-acetyl-beta-L-altrosamine transaminase, partial [Steroidobacteraceae bacterium]|nr:UDP-4-amino-4,6-dideoxy-N-acetyl-beta-L-altrosamine transaminase [Steroidobacteraceae bacterium]